MKLNTRQFWGIIGLVCVVAIAMGLIFSMVEGSGNHKPNFVLRGVLLLWMILSMTNTVSMVFDYNKILLSWGVFVVSILPLMIQSSEGSGDVDAWNHVFLIFFMVYYSLNVLDSAFCLHQKYLGGLITKMLSEE